MGFSIFFETGMTKLEIDMTDEAGRFCVPKTYGCQLLLRWVLPVDSKDGEGHALEGQAVLASLRRGFFHLFEMGMTNVEIGTTRGTG